MYPSTTQRSDVSLILRPQAEGQYLQNVVLTLDFDCSVAISLVDLSAKLPAHRQLGIICTE
jgi:hypothetical protein